MNKFNGLIKSDQQKYTKYYEKFVKWQFAKGYENGISIEKYISLFKKQWRWQFFFVWQLKKTPQKKYIKPDPEAQNAKVDSGKTVTDTLVRLAKQAKSEGATITQIAAVGLQVNKLRKTMSDKKVSGWWIGNGARLLKTPKYVENTTLIKVEPGDVIYEPTGFFGLTGHTAIVEGKFYDAEKDCYFVRGMESIDPFGVIKSVWDDERVEIRNVSFYRANNATQDDIYGILEWIETQLGKKYAIKWNKEPNDANDTWFCSELVCAGYKTQGIDLGNWDLLRNLTNLKDAIKVAASKERENYPAPLNVLDIISAGLGTITPHILAATPTLTKVI